MKETLFTAKKLTEIFDYIYKNGDESDMSFLSSEIKKITRMEVSCPDKTGIDNSVNENFPNAQIVTEEQIEKLNAILPWSTIVSYGEKFQGLPWDEKKRASLHAIPDRHIAEIFDVIRDGRVLEIGCHEGVYTLGLLKAAAHVVALDGRMENVIKTLSRVWLANELDRVDVVCHDLETLNVPKLGTANEAGLDFELMHHNGVLYHLSDPLGHLDNMFAENEIQSVFLDTHVATDEQCNDVYVNGGKDYSVYNYKEPAIRNVSPFAGITPVAKWLRYDDLLEYLNGQGFENVVSSEVRLERNGSRCRILCKKN